MLGRGYIRNISESRGFGVWTEKVCVCVCMCMCVCERQRDRERGERQGERA